MGNLKAFEYVNPACPQQKKNGHIGRLCKQLIATHVEDGDL